MKRTIAVDIDDVLAANAAGIVSYSNQKWGTHLAPEDFRENWAGMLQISHEEAEKRAKEFHLAGVVGQYPHDETAKAVLKQLGSRYKLVITTSRRQELVKETTEWIAKYFSGIFEEIHYAGLFDDFTENSHLATKAELCQQIGADYLIDDQLKHCLAAAEVGIEAVLFGDYKWNQAATLPPKVIRAKTWSDVLEYFEERSR